MLAPAEMEPSPPPQGAETRDQRHQRLLAQLQAAAAPLLEQMADTLADAPDREIFRSAGPGCATWGNRSPPPPSRPAWATGKRGPRRRRRRLPVLPGRRRLHRPAAPRRLQPQRHAPPSPRLLPLRRLWPGALPERHVHLGEISSFRPSVLHVAVYADNLPLHGWPELHDPWDELIHHDPFGQRVSAA